MVERLHAGFDRHLLLAADVDLARRIAADQHDRETRHHTMVARQPCDLDRDLRARRCRDRFAVDDCGSHFVTPVSRSKLVASAPPLPAIFSRLMRAVSPAISDTRVGGTASVRAINCTRALLASPSLAAARTLALSTARPSANCAIPSIASRPPFGVSRTVNSRPSGVDVQGGAGAKLNRRSAGCRARSRSG